MAAWTVKMIFPEGIDPQDEELLGELGEILPPGANIYSSRDDGITEIRLPVEAEDMAAAVRAGELAVDCAVQLLGVVPDAAEVLSEREHLRRLGGPSALAQIQAWLEESE